MKPIPNLKQQLVKKEKHYFEVKTAIKLQTITIKGKVSKISIWLYVKL